MRMRSDCRPPGGHMEKRGLYTGFCGRRLQQVLWMRQANNFHVPSWNLLSAAGRKVW